MLNEEEVEYNPLACDKCECVYESENDLLPYEELNVCESCYDELRLEDERQVQEWETEGYDYD